MSFGEELAAIDPTRMQAIASARISMSEDMGYQVDDATKKIIIEKYPGLLSLYTVLINDRELLGESLDRELDGQDLYHIAKAAGKVITILVDYAEITALEQQTGFET